MFRHPPQSKGHMLALHTLQQLGGDKEQDGLPFPMEGGEATGLQEADSCAKLDTVTYPAAAEKRGQSQGVVPATGRRRLAPPRPRLPVSALDAHGHAVVELQPGDVPEPQHDAGAVRPADALGQLLEVGPGAVACKAALSVSPGNSRAIQSAGLILNAPTVVEVTEVAGVEKEVSSEEVSEPPPAWSEG